MALPLEGIRILAITQYGAGPFAMLQLADLGAEIIKIENPLTAGDVARTVPPYLVEGVNDSIYFQSFNRNSKSVTLNLQHPKGVEALHRLVKVAHGLYSNLRGDLPTRMKLRYRDLKGINPAIVTCHLTGYGLENSRSARPSYDFLVQAEAGMMDVTGEPDGSPQRCGVSVVDFAGGFNSAFALAAGLVQAQRAGVGCDLDVSLFDTTVSMMTYLAAWHLSRGFHVARQPDSSHQSQVPVGVFPTRDGFIMVMCAKEEFYRSLCDILGKPEWKEDPRFRRFPDRLQHRHILVPMLKDEFRKKTSAEWLKILGNDVPCAPVNDFAAAMADPFLKERDLVMELAHPALGTVRLVGSGVKADAPRPEPRVAPGLGEHTEEVLVKLGGYAAAEVRVLREARAI